MPEDDVKPVESTAPPIVEPVAPDLGRDEAAETGTVGRDEVDELIAKRPSDPPPPPAAAPPQEPPHTPAVVVSTTEPPPWMWWVAVTLCGLAIVASVLYVRRARTRETPGGDSRSDAPTA